MDLLEIAKLIGNGPSSQTELPSSGNTTNTAPPAQTGDPALRPPTALKATLEQRIAAMRAEIKEKERLAAASDLSGTHSPAATASATVSAPTSAAAISNDATASSVNFSILDKALATHGFEAMSESDEEEEDIPGAKIERASDSSDSDSDDDSSDDDDEEEEERKPITAEERERILIAADGEGEGAASTAPLRTKNEHAEEEEPVAIPTEEVLATDEVRLLGHVASLVGQTCVIAGVAPASTNTTGQSSSTTPQSVLDVGSLLVLGDRRNVGYIADTFGPVAAPLFAVRFQSAEQVAMLNLESGTAIYMVPRYARYVFGDTLRVKGSDASNIHDEEVGGDEVEFSDDEQEAAYKKMLKEMRKGGKGGAAAAGGGESRRPISDLDHIAAQQQDGAMYPGHAEAGRSSRGGRGGGGGGMRGRGRGAGQQARNAPRQPYQRAFYTPDAASTSQGQAQEMPPPAPQGYQVYAPLKRPDA